MKVFLILLITTTITTTNPLPPSPNNQKSITKPNNLNIKTYISSFNAYDCFLNPKDPNKTSNDLKSQTLLEKYNQICLNKLQNSKFGILSDPNFGNSKLFNYLNEEIYKPIACNVLKRSTISEVITDLYNISSENSLLDKKTLNINYNDFEEEVLKLYANLEKTMKVEDNGKQLNKGIVDILKNFHIYWNSLRLAKKIKRVKYDTMDVMRNLLTQNDVKQKFLFDITKMLVKKIKEAYKRFIEAHQALESIKLNGAEIIVTKIFERYQNYVKMLQSGEVDYTQFVYELTMNLELCKAFFIFLFKNGKNEQQIENEFNKKVFEKIKIEYLTQNYQNSKKLTKEVIKHFTVTLLLKLKNLKFIILEEKGISEISDISEREIPVSKQLSVKVYYEILDNMLVLPKKCENFISLENCIFLESGKILRYITNKYLLKRSVSGWGLFSKISKIFKNLNSGEISRNSENMTVFKRFFYRRLFSKLFSYKKKYKIKDSKSLDFLENGFSKKIEIFKKKIGPFKIDFELIDQLDIDIYDEILEIRANFDDFVPFFKNEGVVKKIGEHFRKFFENFEIEYSEKINGKFKELLSFLKNEILVWENQTKKNEIKKSDFSDYPELLENTHDVIDLPVETLKIDPIGEKSSKMDFYDEKPKNPILEKNLPKKKVEEIYRDFGDDEYKHFMDGKSGFAKIPQSVKENDDFDEEIVDQYNPDIENMDLDQANESRK